MSRNVFEGFVKSSWHVVVQYMGRFLIIWDYYLRLWETKSQI